MAKQRTHYIDNKEFYKQIVAWKKEVKAAEESDDPRPPVTNYIGECIMKIAEHLSQKPNFANYPFKEEMIGDGIENCLMYAHNFNPRKSKNPFSYFTQIIYFAFLRRIEKEKKQAYVKLKMTELLDDGTVHRWLKQNYLEDDNKEENPLLDIMKMSEGFEKSKKTKPKKKLKKRKK
jgi:hypothetical protein